ncbi:E3 ubiquitin-protein ligase RNF8 [Trichoplax sp. H2]|nr:E3 ubiquitin-protein ligase RNF8 [Trichoplax sp. H2]|eukprot:RDD36077.1 E3 ubiquitin-protein ligase RNF8 [Trichoplax sp. H2]
MLLVTKKPRYWLRNCSDEIIYLKYFKTRLHSRAKVYVYRYDTGEFWLRRHGDGCQIIVNRVMVRDRCQLFFGDKIDLVLPGDSYTRSKTSAYFTMTYRLVAHLPTATLAGHTAKVSSFKTSAFQGEHHGRHGVALVGVDIKHRRHANSPATTKDKCNRLLKEIVKQPTKRIEKTIKRKEDKAKHWIDSLKENLICSICRDWMIDVQNLSCSHSFCKACIDQWFHNHHEQTCPVCRNAITAPATPVRLMNQLIELFINNELDEEEMRRFRSRQAKLETNCVC